MMKLAAIQAAEIVADVNPEIEGLALAFMLISMSAVVLMTVWCFARLLRTKQHFDPDGTGPAKPPVSGRTQKGGGR